MKANQIYRKTFTGKIEWRWCEDIGMFAYDRPIDDVTDEYGRVLAEGSCVHATEHCKATCYNNKLYKVYPAMSQKDIRNEAQWQALGVNTVKPQLDKKRKFTDRVRSCTRGEPIKNTTDVSKLYRMALANPDRIFWIPTRAWRDSWLRAHIRGHLLHLPNVSVCASMDPSNTKAEWQMVTDAGWSTMFFGDDDMTETPTGERMFMCPKTHKDLKGHCAICKAGCMSASVLGKQSHSHLKEH